MRYNVSRGSNIPHSGLAARLRVQYENTRDAATWHMANVEQNPYVRNLMELGSHMTLFDTPTMAVETASALANAYQESHLTSDHATESHDTLDLDHRNDSGMEHKARDGIEDAHHQEQSADDESLDKSDSAGNSAIQQDLNATNTSQAQEDFQASDNINSERGMTTNSATPDANNTENHEASSLVQSDAQDFANNISETTQDTQTAGQPDESINHNVSSLDTDYDTRLHDSAGHTLGEPLAIDQSAEVSSEEVSDSNTIRSEAFDERIEDNSSGENTTTSHSNHDLAQAHADLEQQEETSSQENTGDEDTDEDDDEDMDTL